MHRQATSVRLIRRRQDIEGDMARCRAVAALSSDGHATCSRGAGGGGVFSDSSVLFPALGYSHF
jgi:hypothetical protein